MIVAKEKRKNNIGEYILYMWQVEDLIRALKLDMELIDEQLIAKYQVDTAQKTEVKNWYQNLVLMMQKEQKSAGGHLQFLVNVVDDLNRFHLSVIAQDVNPEYSSLFNEIKDDIDLIRQKSKLDHHDIEVALNTLYIILMLKMKNQEVTEGTQMAVWKFGNFIGHLSVLYKAYELGELDIEF